MNAQTPGIHLEEVKDFYSEHEEIYDIAVDAVVKGCVTQYHFDNEAHKFVGKVSSLDGMSIFDVEIAVTETLVVSAASCNCPSQEICFHIGALALNTGYETPVFVHQDDANDNSTDTDTMHPAPSPSTYVNPRWTKIMTGHEFLKLGNKYTMCSLSKSEKLARTQFKSFFAVSATVCSIIWHKVKDDIPIPGAFPKHLLFCLAFLKKNQPESHRRSILGIDEKTLRKWTWIFVQLISNLNVVQMVPKKIVSLHCEVCLSKYKPKKCDQQMCPRFKVPGLRYELALSIKTGQIVWAFGGYPDGSHPDLKLAKQKFIPSLRSNERAMADKSYKDEKYFILPNDGNRTQH